MTTRRADRTSDFDNTPSKRRKFSAGSDYEDDANLTGAEEQEDVESATTTPDEMLELIKEFEEYVVEKKGQGTHVKNIDRLIKEWAGSRDANSFPVDAAVWSKDFKKYLKTSMKLANISLSNAFSITSDFLSRAEALSEYPDYPRRTPVLVRIYIDKTGMSKSVAEIGDATKAMKNDTTGAVEECKKELVEIEKQHVIELEKFLLRHPNLTEAQKKTVDNRIKALKKKVSPVSRAPKTPSKPKAIREPVTAFTLFCKSMSTKYTDLDDEARMKKLKKKFAKIDDAQLQMLEAIALNS